MPIQVTCPKCLTRFAVSEKFAGKKGPCPKCKAQIEVPKETDAVVIHAPADDAPKDSKGRSVLTPLKRKETRLSRRQILIVSGSVLLAIGVAVGLRFVGEGVKPFAIALGALFIAPPLIWAGYSVSYDQELDPYVGRELQIRVLILSAVFAALWMVYAYVPTYVLELEKPSEMPIVVAAIMFAIVLAFGTFAAVAAFELETIGGMTLAGVYFVSTLALAYLAGVPLFGVEPEPRRRSMPQASPSDADVLQIHWSATTVAAGLDANSCGEGVRLHYASRGAATAHSPVALPRPTPYGAASSRRSSAAAPRLTGFSCWAFFLGLAPPGYMLSPLRGWLRYWGTARYQRIAGEAVA